MLGIDRHDATVARPPLAPGAATSDTDAQALAHARAPRPAPWERLVDVVVSPATAFRGLATEPNAALAIAVGALLELARVNVAYAPARAAPAVVLTALLQLLVVSVPIAALAAGLRVALAGARGVSYRAVFAIVAHTAVPYHVVALVVAAGAVAAGIEPPAGSGHHEASLAWLADPEVAPIRHRLLGAVDLGRIWQLALVSIGLRVAFRDVGRGRATAAVVAVWGAYLLVVAAVALARA